MADVLSLARPVGLALLLLGLLLPGARAHAQESEFEGEEEPEGAGEALAEPSAIEVLTVEQTGEPQAVDVVAVPVAREAAPAGVPTQFFSEDPAGEVVFVQDQACRTPCVLRLNPGLSPVTVVGDRRMFRAELRVPPEPSAFDLTGSERALLVTLGGLMVPAGAAVAASLWSLAFTCGWDSGGCAAAHLITWPVLGGLTFIAGWIVLGIGLGHQTGELRPSRRAIQRTLGDLRLRSFGLAPTPDGGAAGSLTFDF